MTNLLIEIILKCFSFLIGSAPVSVVRFINIAFQEAAVTDCDQIFKLHVGSMVGLSILRFAESINPLIYTIGSKSLRVEVKKVFGLRTRPNLDAIKMKKVTTIT